ncbi:hypothetical protein FRC09_013407, partial [Ceratobasidium sp. 395]
AKTTNQITSPKVQQLGAFLTPQVLLNNYDVGVVHSAAVLLRPGARKEKRTLLPTFPMHQGDYIKQPGSATFAALPPVCIPSPPLASTQLAKHPSHQQPPPALTEDGCSNDSESDNKVVTQIAAPLQVPKAPMDKTKNSTKTAPKKHAMPKLTQLEKKGAGKETENYAQD